MDMIYDLGVTSIELVQDLFQPYEGYFEKVNKLSDPQYLLEFLFPFISIFDSVFAAQLLIVLAFGGWTNAMMKWIFLEDRPYWWVQETSYYSNDKPNLLQTNQTCMASYGSPSVHTTTAASVLILSTMWLSHIVNDKKWNAWPWKKVVYPVVAFALASVVLARMYVAAQFPHQCFLGVLLGLILAPALCMYLTDPFLWQYGPYQSMPELKVLCWHVGSALAAILFSVVTYYSLILGGVDPRYTEKLAYRWCRNRQSIDVSTTPVFSILMWTANMLAWTAGVAPDLTEYRYNSQNRFLSISITFTILTMCVMRGLEQSVRKDGTVRYYALHFLLNCFRPGFYLRTIPAMAMMPYYELFNKQ